MAFEQKDNSGAAFVNDRREKDTHPHYRGQVMVDGKEYWVSLWVKKAGEKAKNPGQKFLSIAFTDKGEQSTIPQSQAEALLDDDIPF